MYFSMEIVHERYRKSSESHFMNQEKVKYQIQVCIQDS